MKQDTMADYMKQQERVQRQFFRYMASGTMVVDKNLVELNLRNYAAQLSASYNMYVEPQTINVVVLAEEPPLWKHCCGAGGIQAAQPMQLNFYGVDIKFIFCNFCHKLIYYADYTNAMRIDKGEMNGQNEVIC